MRHTVLCGFIAFLTLLISCNKPSASNDPGVYNTYRLSLYDIESGELTTVHNFGTLEYDYRPEFALFSPDGTKIVYYRKYELHCINVDGSGKTVVSGDLRADRDFPTTAPDGVYFSAYNGDLRDIYFTPWDETQPQNITNTMDTDERHPYAHESGEKILYVADDHESSSLIEHVLSNDTSIAVFSNPNRQLHYPAFSPISSKFFLFNGAHLSVYDADIDSVTTIFTNSHYQETGQLTFNTTYEYLPCCAGDGNIVNYRTLDTIQILPDHIWTNYPCVSESSTLYAYSSGSGFIYDFEISDYIGSIVDGYYSRFSLDDSKMLIFIRHI